MADKKISELPEINSVSDDDLLLVINDPAGTPTSNKITFGNFKAPTDLRIDDRIQVANVNVLLSEIAADYTTTSYADATYTTYAYSTATYAGTDHTHDGLYLTVKQADPATSNAATEGISSGTMFFSNTHLYIAVDADTIKRIALESF